jgi:transposase
MTGRIKYTEEFKRDAVAQVSDRGHSVLEVSRRLGVSTKSLYDWIKRYGRSSEAQRKDAEHTDEIRRLKAELARVTEERDILKKATAYFAKESR